VVSTEPRVKFYESDAGADEKLWDFRVASKILYGRLRTDADGNGGIFLTVGRSGNQLSGIGLGSSPQSNVFLIMNPGALPCTVDIVTGQVRIRALPTSATGLDSGTLWNDNGTVKVA
jgi:hypothetical protein